MNFYGFPTGRLNIPLFNRANTSNEENAHVPSTSPNTSIPFLAKCLSVVRTVLRPEPAPSVKARPTTPQPTFSPKQAIHFASSFSVTIDDSPKSEELFPLSFVANSVPKSPSEENAPQIVSTIETVPSAQPLASVVDAVLFANEWKVLSELSVRKDCFVLVVVNPSHNKYVIRVSRDCEKHRAFEFGEFWANKRCPYFPRMEEPQIVGLGDDGDGGDCVVEQYELVNHSVYGSCDFYGYLHASDQQLKWKYMYDVVCGVKWLVDHNWCHADLSIENIVCGDDGAKIIDFESSLSYYPSVTQPVFEFGPTKILYRPPELDSAQYLVFAEHVDIWSVGVMLFAVATNSFPFSDEISERESQFEFVRRHGFRNYVAEHLGQEYVEDLGDILSHLLERIFIVYKRIDVGDGYFVFQPPTDGGHRLTPSQVMEHAFFDGIHQR